ncbi:MAG: RNA polymerase sigma factor [Gammaproteobacteria bacterium]
MLSGDLSAPIVLWHGIDLRWAYVDLLRGIRRRVGCPERAQDVLHDALVRTALVHERSPLSEPHAYLRTVVRTVLVDQHRDQARWVTPLDADVDAEPDAAADLAPSAERMAQLQECLAAAQRVLDQLPPRRREVFWLFRVEGYACREIAERLGLSLKTVQNHVMRVIVTLRDAEEMMG